MKNYKKIMAWMLIVLMGCTLLDVPAGTVEAAAKSKVKSISLNHEQYTLKKNKKLKLKATVLPKKSKATIIWKSSKKSVASVSNKGVVKAHKKGTAKITATVKGTKKKATCKVTVGTPVTKVKFEQNTMSMSEGQQLTIKATVSPKNASNKKLTWTSSDENIAKVENGVITAVRAGTATITAQAKDGSKKKAKLSIMITPAVIPVQKVNVVVAKNKLYVDEKTTATAMVEPANASVKTVTWSVSDSSVVTIDANGNIVAKKTGKANVIATANNNIAGMQEIEVLAVPVSSVQVDQTTMSLRVNETGILVASVLPENAGNKSVTWSSSNSTVATVSEAGLITALAPGETFITAKTVDGNKEASCKVKVENAIAVSSFDELEETLGKTYESIYLQSNESGEYEIEGEYEDISLIVDTPNATITNKATFDSIQIKAISENTWIEEAIGNIIDLIAEKAHVIVNGMNVRLQISEGATDIHVENEGLIDNIKISTNVALHLSGSNKTKIPVQSQMAGTEIKTDIPIDLDADDDFMLHVLNGAETSTVAVANDGVNTTINGIGVIPVRDKTTDEIVDIVAENIENIDIKGNVTGLIYNAAGQLLTDVNVCMIPYVSAINENEIASAIEAARNADRCYEMTTDENGQYVMSKVPYGNYLMVATMEGLQTYFLTVVLNQENATNEAITMLEQTDEVGSIIGTLYDAFDASAVPEGITLIIRKNHNNTSGIAVATTTTNASGQYQFADLQAGNYTIQVMDKRTDIATDDNAYIRMSYNVTVVAGETVVEDMTISRQVEDTQIRFVLTWGEEKESVSSDLDSHLIGPDVAGGKFHTYFSEMSYAADGVQYADLDVDDVSYEGPETTTVYTALSGVYHFYVYDYSNQEDSQNTILSTSEAVVKVYRGEQNVATYNVPNEIGTLWDVCTYDIATNTLTPINTVMYHPGNSENVGVDPIDIAKKNLIQVINQYEDVYFGEVLSDSVETKLANARELYATETDVEVMSTFTDELRDYFATLVSSTRIHDVGSEAIVRYSVKRRGDEEYDLKEYSVIELQMKDLEADISDISVTLGCDTATYAVKVSDKEEYSKLIEVTDSATNAVEKYYVLCKEFVPSLYPQDVSDGDNYIVSSYWDYFYDEEDNEIPYYYIAGENESLASPIFTFEDEEITYNYVASTEEDKEYAGILYVTYRSKELELPVKYVQRLRTIYINEIEDAGNYIADWDYDWVWDEEEDAGYKVYEISGVNAELGLDTQFTFNVEGAEYELIKESGFAWNYILRVTYKGITTDMYINYSSDANILPSNAWYVEDYNYKYFKKIEKVTEDEEEVIVLHGAAATFSMWELIEISDRGSLTYDVRLDGEQPYLDIYLGEEVLMSYPVRYQMCLDSSCVNVTDEGNYIISRSYGTDYLDEEKIYCVTIFAENPELSDAAEFTYSEEGVDVVYESVVDSEDYIGKVTLSYENLSMEVWVQYVQQIREAYIYGIEDADNAIISYSQSYQYDEEDNMYWLYDVIGVKDELALDTIFTFNLEGAEYELTKEEGLFWNYKLLVTYKGVTQTRYINYTKADASQLLPSYGNYIDDTGMYMSISGFEIEEDGTDCKIIAYGASMEVADWTTILVGAYNGLTYKVEYVNGTVMLYITKGETVLASYPFEYRFKLSNRVLSYVDPDNYVSSYDRLTATDEDGTMIEIVHIAAENPSINTEAFEVCDENIEFVYEMVEDSDLYVGKVILSYGEQQVEVWIEYEQKIRDLNLFNIQYNDKVIRFSGSISQYIGDKFQNVFLFEGEEPILTTDMTYTFDASGCDVLSVTAVDEEAYNCILEVEYMDEIQYVYVDYTVIEPETTESTESTETTENPDEDESMGGTDAGESSETTESTETTEEEAIVDFVKEVANLVNAEREKEGLEPLNLDENISEAALCRAKELQESFSHTRPDGSSCFTILDECNISYSGAGENIAYGQTSPEEVMNSWMNSEGHRANILSEEFTSIGVGYYEVDGVDYWVQLFTY